MSKFKYYIMYFRKITPYLIYTQLQLSKWNNQYQSQRFTQNIK